MTLLRALSIALLLVASAVLWQSSPASAMSDCQTNIITQSVTCTYVLPGGEGSVTVSCVPHPEYGCPTVVCDDQYIPDDSIHLQGLTWANGGIPVPTELGEPSTRSLPPSARRWVHHRRGMRRRSRTPSSRVVCTPRLDDGTSATPSRSYVRAIGRQIPVRRATSFR